MTDMNSRIESEAVDWLRRVNEPDFADWDNFDAWLARDPRYQEIYYRIADADRDFVEELGRRPSPVAVVGVQPAPAKARNRSWQWAAGIAASAAVAITGTIWLVPTTPPARTIVETQPGIQRTLRLADGSKVDLNGATRLSYDASDPRQLRLEQGEALFSVIHDPKRPFTLEVGDMVVRDVGTVFDVVRNEGEDARIEVSQGEVSLEAGRLVTRVAAGDSLERRGADLVSAHVGAASVGGWQRGRLFYDDAPVSRVTADLARSTGQKVRLDALAAGRHFSGSIGLGGPPASLIPHAADLMGLGVKRQADGWLLTARGVPPS